MVTIKRGLMKFFKNILYFLYWSFIVILLILNIIFGLLISWYNPTFWSDLYYTIVSSI